MVFAGIVDAFARVFFRSAKVTAVSTPHPSFRFMDLHSDEFKTVRFAPGDKVQVRVTGSELRTYSPFAWDVTTGTVRLAAFIHGDGPGAEWARKIAVGDTIQFFGPRGSIDLTVPEPIVLFGDETSFAVAASRPPRKDDRFVFEVGPGFDAITSALGLENVTLCEKGKGDAALNDHLREGRRAVFTGRAQSIQAVKAALKLRGIALKGAQTKAYWAEGKRGLD